MSYELVVKNGVVVTAGATYRADIGVRAGKSPPSAHRWRASR